MKYFLIIVGVIAVVLFIGYQYLNYKFLNAQEASFKELATLKFDESDRAFPDSIRMKDKQFWSLIEESEAKHPNKFDAQMNYLTQRLSTLTNEEIIGFEATLKEKMIELWDYNLKSLYQIVQDEYVSTDGFIYYRFWIISNGKDFFQRALANPDLLADEIQATYDGQGLMVVADNAFKLKNGANTNLELPRDVTTAVHYDFGNYRMSGDYISPSDFKDKFPKLVKKF
ncbi:DUF4240 domain-containing protein [Pontibacter populi]|uniref:DUF4240 domain-containing protein n=1 Tax=Pontibacter populi TaxID=890055 RepID=A0ABV1RU89_9BACT